MSLRTHLCAALACLWVLVPSSSLGQGRAPQHGSVQVTDLESDVSFLASDEMRGRLVGTPENRLAAAFIRSRFERSDLKPAAAENYLMPFDLITSTLGTKNTMHLRSASGDWGALEIGSDFYPEQFSGTGSAEGPVVFVGFGISAPALRHDDYGDTDVAGKVVLMLDHEPGELDVTSPFYGVVASEHGRALRKALEAQRRGAVAVLIVSDVHNHEVQRPLPDLMDTAWAAEPPRIPRYQLAAWVDQLRIPVMRISPLLTERIATGTKLDILAQHAETPGGPPPMTAEDVVIELTASVNRERVTQYNVVGLIEGSDPTLKDEWIILCAHFDHQGATDARIFNGADDDASGVAGLIEIAEAYALAARAGHRPRRSILFAAWNAEERGLLGAWAYTEHPLIPLEQTVAVINMDMIGRNEEVPPDGGRRFRGLDPQTATSNRNTVNILGYSYSQDLRRATEAANEGIDLTLRFRYDNNRSNLLRRSDHWPFLTRGVPAIFIHTGLHPDYHTEHDRPERLNYNKMARIVQLVHQLSWNLTQDDGRPAFE